MVISGSHFSTADSRRKTHLLKASLTVATLALGLVASPVSFAQVTLDSSFRELNRTDFVVPFPVATDVGTVDTPGSFDPSISGSNSLDTFSFEASQDSFVFNTPISADTAAIIGQGSFSNSVTTSAQGAGAALVNSYLIEFTIDQPTLVLFDFVSEVLGDDTNVQGFVNRVDLTFAGETTGSVDTSATGEFLLQADTYTLSLLLETEADGLLVAGDAQTLSATANFTLTTVPEPGSLALLALGGGLLAARRRRA